jgi:hypothetical protein
MLPLKLASSFGAAGRVPLVGLGSRVSKMLRASLEERGIVAELASNQVHSGQTLRLRWLPR